ncbi:response regulator [Methylomicrobium lacus]|uniref:hybrid sensor histidine kinase/response regulator n=1 Tax=Methylomicrobium lacus TaxID=136992 RepID=UPI0035A8E0FB
MTPTTPCVAETLLAGDPVCLLEHLADQSAQEGWFGLQDANLILAEALRELRQDQDLDLGGGVEQLLADWSDLVEKYRTDCKRTAKAIIHYLRRPELKVPLVEDEFNDLELQLCANDEADIHAMASEMAVEFSGNLSAVAQEIIDLLLLQCQTIRNSLLDIAKDDSASVAEGLQQAGEALERFFNAANTAGFTGLAQICAHVNANIGRFLEQADSFGDEPLELLFGWLSQVQDYLPVFNEDNAGQLLVAGLADRQWPLPMSFEAVAEMLLKMRSEGASVISDSVPVRPQAATAEDIALDLPDDVNSELLELLLQELPLHTQQFSEAVRRLQAGGGEEDVNLAQRAAHTLKGSANTVGVKGIAVLTHHLEDILIACAREQKLPDRRLTDALMHAADCLEGMSEALLGLGAPPADATAVLQDILDWANRIDLDGLPDASSEETYAESAAASVDAGPSIDNSEAQAAMVRVAADQIEKLFRLSGESIILNGQAQESSRRLSKQLQGMRMQFTLLRQLGEELERLIDLKDLTGRTSVAADAGFDALEMDQYNELHTVSRRMAEAALDAREIGQDIEKELGLLGEVLEDQQRDAIDAQETIMQTRLAPVSSIASRLQRGLRQTCRLTGKSCDLTLTGESVLIDGDLLNTLVEPLMHLIRNAVDHGIEDAQARVASGKPQNGRLVIDFAQEGNRLRVRCRDDGRGLDYAAIQAAAEKRGALTPGQPVSEAELQRFILRPNFSTRTVTTQTSGRGVGMDAVYARIVALGGTMTMDSATGQGMTVELRVPLPLSLTHALLVNAGRFRVAIAGKGIAQVHHIGDCERLAEDHSDTLVLGGQSYPSVRLDRLLHIPEQRKPPRPPGAVLLIQHEEKTTAVLVDSVIDTAEVVIKPMGNYLGKIPGFIGATILGDGAVTPVLDLPELLRAPIRPIDAIEFAALESAVTEAALPTILVVDDSLSQRRALEQLLVDAGYKVRSARDGIEAVELLRQFKPQLVLTDLEMPRMNGIELTAHIRKQTGQTRLPVIMITSRTTQKHRQMAEEAGIDAYLAKPVRDDDLLTHIMHLLPSNPSLI